MFSRTPLLIALGVLLFSLGASSRGAAQNVNRPIDPFQPSHPVVGSWFGKAVQLCPDPALCPQVALYMTPTLLADGQFIGNDDLTLGGAPFGPHTVAHGHWIRTSRTAIIADYVFMLPSFPPTPTPTTSALRFRWQAEVTDRNTMIGYVNIYLFPPIPVNWEPLGIDQYPTIPPEAQAIVTSPTGFVKDPLTCTAPGCPLVFKFKIHRVAP